MKFLFGYKTRYERIETIDTACPQCGRKPCGLYWAEPRVTVSLVPVVTLKRKYVVGCSHCDKYWDIDQSLGQKIHSHLQDASSQIGALKSLADTVTRDNREEAQEGLIEAAHAGDVGRIKGLLKSGVDVNTADMFGETALLAAAEEGHEKAVRALVDRGANVKARGGASGATALHQAAQQGNARVVQFLLDKGAEVNAGDNNGATPLIRAAENGHKEVVELLLQKGADVNATSHNGFTALMRAFINGHSDIADRLRQAGATR